MAGHRVFVVRANGEGFFESRDLFVQTNGPVGAESRICQVVDRRVRAAGLATPAGGDLPLAGLPWLTPVLGSGCLDVRGSQGLTADSFRIAVINRIGELLAKQTGVWKTLALREQRVPQHREFGLAEYAGKFAAALAGDRLILDDPAGRAGGDPAREVDVSELAAVALVGSSGLNYVYFLAKARLPRPAAKSDTEAVVIDPAREEEDALTSICQEAFLNLRASISSELGRSQPQVAAAIDRLLDRLLAGIGNRRVELSDLRLLIEVTWYLLITPEVALYPGWGDLLFKLMLVDDTPHQVSSRPWFNNLSYVGARAVEFFRPPTEQSWLARNAHEVPLGMQARFALYDALAEVLDVQSESHRATQNPDLPVPAAFVTSFDVELEMALHARLDESRSIYVIVPVQVLPTGDSESAKLCWLRAQIDRKSATGPGSLDAFLRPTGWELVQPTLETGLSDPHVVHLGGSPLLELPAGVEIPQVANVLSDVEVTFDPQSMVVAHAVGVDEYLALQQSEDEILWTITKPGELEGKLSLPALLTSGSKTVGAGANPRFWVLLGVPLDDPAVRNRVVTHLTLQRLREKVPPTDTDIESASDSGGFGGFGDEDSGGFGAVGGDDSGGFGSPTEDSPERRTVFVSHSTADRVHGDAVVRRLTEAGLSCSYSQFDIDQGDDWLGWIDSELTRAGAMVVLVSATSCDPQGWVFKEVRTALKRGIPVFVLLVDGSPPTGQMEITLSHINHKNLQEPDHDARERMWQELIRQLRDCVGAPEVEVARVVHGEPTGLIGVVVNLRISSEDAGVLHWLGFDVVRDEAERFVDDLRHYSAHVAAAQWAIPSNAFCNVGSGGAE